MSHFGSKLTSLLERKAISANQLADLSGLSPAHIWKLCTGKQKWVSEEDLEKIATAVTTNAHEQAELVFAHLLDECYGPGSELIEIKIKDTSAEVLRETYLPQLSPKMRGIFDTLIRESELDSDLRETLVSLAYLVAPELKLETVKPVPQKVEKSPASKREIHASDETKLLKKAKKLRNLTQKEEN